MKITQEYLKELITEEVNAMAESGELDEGFLDALRGAAGKVGGDVAKKASAGAAAVSAAVDSARKSVADYTASVVKAANTASTKADAAKVVSMVSANIDGTIATLSALEKRSEELQLGYNFTPMINSLDNAKKALANVQKRMGVAPAAAKPAAAPAVAETEE